MCGRQLSADSLTCTAVAAFTENERWSIHPFHPWSFLHQPSVYVREQPLLGRQRHLTTHEPTVAADIA
jgi:hypothetical protein